MKSSAQYTLEKKKKTVCPLRSCLVNHSRDKERRNNTSKKRKKIGKKRRKCGSGKQILVPGDDRREGCCDGDDARKMRKRRIKGEKERRWVGGSDRQMLFSGPNQSLFIYLIAYTYVRAGRSFSVSVCECLSVIMCVYPPLYCVTFYPTIYYVTLQSSTMWLSIPPLSCYCLPQQSIMWLFIHSLLCDSFQQSIMWLNPFSIMWLSIHQIIMRVYPTLYYVTVYPLTINVTCDCLSNLVSFIVFIFVSFVH